FRTRNSCFRRWAHYGGVGRDSAFGPGSGLACVPARTDPFYVRSEPQRCAEPRKNKFQRTEGQLAGQYRICVSGWRNITVGIAWRRRLFAEGLTRSTERRHYARLRAPAAYSACSLENLRAIGLKASLAVSLRER